MNVRRAPNDEEITAEIATAIETGARGVRTGKKMQMVHVRALMFTSRPTLLPVTLRELQIDTTGEGEDGWTLVWDLQVAAADTNVYVNARYWQLRDLSEESAAQSRYYQAIAARVNYIRSLQETLQLYHIDSDGRRVRRKKCNVSTDKHMSFLQPGMTSDAYVRLKKAYRGTFTNFDIVEELYSAAAAADGVPDHSHDESGNEMLDLLLHSGDSDSSDSDDNDLNSSDLEAAADSDTELASNEYAQEPDIEDAHGRRTTTHIDRKRAKCAKHQQHGRNVFGHLVDNKKRQMRRRHPHNPKARAKQQRAGSRGDNTSDRTNITHAADLHAVRKRRMFTHQAHVNTLLKRYLRAYTPLIARMDALVTETRGLLTDTMLENDVTFMSLWHNFHLEYEYDPGDASYMQWYVTDTPDVTDPFVVVAHAGYTCSYPVGIDSVLHAAAASSTPTAPAPATGEFSAEPSQWSSLSWPQRFAAFYKEVLAYEWSEGFGRALWYATFPRNRAVPPPPPLEGHAVFWVTYFNVYQLEMAVRGRQPGISRKRGHRRMSATEPERLRFYAQRTLTGHIPLVCYLRREWATQFALPHAPTAQRQRRGDNYRAKVTDHDIPLDLYEPSPLHMLPGADSPEVVGYDCHLQFIDFWYTRSDETDIIAQIIKKCLPYGSHGRKNTSLGRETLRKKTVYFLFMQRVCRMVLYGLYDIETFDTLFHTSTTTTTADNTDDELRCPEEDLEYQESYTRLKHFDSRARRLRHRRTAQTVTRVYRPSLASMCRLEEEVFCTADAMSSFIMTKSSPFYVTCVCILLHVLLHNIPPLRRILAPMWSPVAPVLMRVGHMARQFVGSLLYSLPSAAVRNRFEDDVAAMRKGAMQLKSYPKGNFMNCIAERLNEIKRLVYAYIYHDVEVLHCLQLVRHHIAHHYVCGPDAPCPTGARMEVCDGDGDGGGNDDDDDDDDADNSATTPVPGSLLEDIGRLVTLPHNTALGEADISHVLTVFGADHIIRMIFHLASSTVESGAESDTPTVLPPVPPVIATPCDIAHYATAFVDELYGPMQHPGYYKRQTRSPINTSSQRTQPPRSASGGDAQATGKTGKNSTRNFMVSKNVSVNAVRHMHISQRDVDHSYTRSRAVLCTLLGPVGAVFATHHAPVMATPTTSTTTTSTTTTTKDTGELLLNHVETWCEARGGWLPTRVAEALLRAVPVHLFWEAIVRYQQYKRAHLRVLQQIPSKEETTKLWQAYTRIKSSEEAVAFVQHVLPKKDLVRFYELIDLYERRDSNALMESKIAEMSPYTIFRLETVLRMRMHVYQICTVPLTADDADNIRYTMATRRYSALQQSDGSIEELPDSVYDVYATPCCERVATISLPKSYGHYRIRYDSRHDWYTCDMARAHAGRRNRKKSNCKLVPPFLDLTCPLEGGYYETSDGGAWLPVLPLDKNDGYRWLPTWTLAPSLSLLAQRVASGGGTTARTKSASGVRTTKSPARAISMFHSMSVNAQRQLCRKGKVNAEEVTCKAAPPLYRVSMRASRMYFGTNHVKRQAFQFCVRCANFDNFTDANWTYAGYACRECRTRLVPSILPPVCSYCTRPVKASARAVPIVDVHNEQRPIEMHHYCATHARMYSYPYTTKTRHLARMDRRNAVMRYMNNKQSQKERQTIDRTNARRKQNRNRR